MIDVSRETEIKLIRLVAEIDTRADQQNLISPGSRPDIWTRHIQDSLQLLPLAPAHGRWLDVGTGAGFPGLVVALAGSHQMTLAEPRRLRAAFLQEMVELFCLTNRVDVLATRIERVSRPPFDIISARAVAPLGALFAAAHHASHPATLWLLPKGRRAASELAEARKTWQGAFALVPSVTDPSAAIVTARAVQRRAKA